jgi:hypothetical protein
VRLFKIVAKTTDQSAADHLNFIDRPFRLEDICSLKSENCIFSPQ